MSGSYLCHNSISISYWPLRFTEYILLILAHGNKQKVKQYSSIGTTANKKAKKWQGYEICRAEESVRRSICTSKHQFVITKEGKL